MEDVQERLPTASYTLRTKVPTARLLKLPEHHKIRREQARITSEADYYGASNIISSILGKKMCPRSFCTWKHGWADLLPLEHPGQLISDNNFKGQNHLVHTQAQADFLQAQGFHNVFAVGMPFAYAWRFFEGPARKRGSLLVMPPHMTKHIDIRYDEDKYLNTVLEAARGFTSVAVCITAACDEHGRWKSASDRLGLRVIKGGDVYDRNSLLRMLSLFSEFNFVTTPQLGSHVVYASLCGCRVSVYGQVAMPEKKAYLMEPYYQRYPEILDLMYSEKAQIFREHVASRFRCRPSDAITHIRWARRQAGVDNLRVPGDLSKLLGWDAGVRIRLIPGITEKIMKKVSAYMAS